VRVVRAEIEQQTSKLITLAGDWGWIDIHHLRVRHVLRNVWVSMVHHSLRIRVAEEHRRERARRESIRTRMRCELDESRRIDMVRTWRRRL
jgi:hypothetical protein